MAARPDHPAGTTIAWTAFGVGVAAAALIAFFESSQVGMYDEGLFLYGGSVVAHGGLPYRDFWSLYGPANFYFLAGAFRAFGESVLTGRAVDLAARAAIVAIAYTFARRTLSTRSALVVAGCGTGILVQAQGFGAPLFPATAFSMLGVLAALEALGRASARHAVVAGVCAAITFAYRTDLGVYSVVAGTYLGFVDRRATGRTPRREAAAFLGTFAVLAGALVATLLLTVPVEDLYDDFVRIALFVYAKNRQLPYPRPAWLGGAMDERPAWAYGVYYPVVVLMLVALDRVFPGRTRSQASMRRDLDFHALLALTLTYMLRGSIRVEFAHAAPALIVATVLLLRLVEERASDGIARGVVHLLLLLVAAQLTWGDRDRYDFERRAISIARWASSGFTRFDCVRPLERLGCFDVSRSERAVLAFVDANTSPGDAIYVGTTRHDKLYVSDVALYFLTARRAPTRWHDLHPGVQTSEPVQAVMIADFERMPPRLVVLDSAFDTHSEPNVSSESSGVDALDRYVHDRYPRQVFESGTFRILVPAR